MSCDERWGRWTNVLVCRTVVPTVHFTTLNTWDNCSTICVPNIRTHLCADLPFWVLENVLLQVFELLRTSNDVIEWCRLPEFSRSASRRVDLTCGVSHPALADNAQAPTHSELYDHVDMIWHHNKPVQVIFVFIVKQHCVANDLSQSSTP